MRPLAHLLTHACSCPPLTVHIASMCPASAPLSCKVYSPPFSLSLALFTLCPHPLSIHAYVPRECAEHLQPLSRAPGSSRAMLQESGWDDGVVLSQKLYLAPSEHLYPQLGSRHTLTPSCTRPPACTTQRPAAAGAHRCAQAHGGRAAHPAQLPRVAGPAQRAASCRTDWRGPGDGLHGSAAGEWSRLRGHVGKEAPERGL